jgi:hypothetical protein
MLNYSPIYHGPSAGTLRKLLDEMGLSRYGVFFSTGEGNEMPDGEEEATGYVIASTGRVYFYAIGWDRDSQAPTFTTWESSEIEPHWSDFPEYLKARQDAGLDS